MFEVSCLGDTDGDKKEEFAVGAPFASQTHVQNAENYNDNDDTMLIPLGAPFASQTQAPAFSGILIPGFLGRDFCKIPGSRDFSGRD